MNRNSAGGEAADRRQKWVCLLLLCAAGTLLNVMGAALAAYLKIPLYLDCAGILISSALGGYLPGIIVGLITSFIKGISDPTSIYYSTVCALIAVAFARIYQKGWLRRRGWLRQAADILLTTAALAFIGGGIGSVLTWFLYGFAAEGISVPFVLRLYETGRLTPFLAQLLADFLLDLWDKLVAVIAALLILRLVPDSWKERLRMEGWQQRPLTREERKAAESSGCRRVSLRIKILVLLTVACVAIAAAATGISYLLYRRSIIEDHIKLGQGTAGLISSVIDPERVADYLELGEQAEGYQETKELLYSIRKSSPDIEYVYAYQIREDGCHVVFDLDTEELAGEAPGTVIPFDASFAPYLEALLAGKPIDPIITDDSYGWLLTVYEPVYDSGGNCVCYGAADISMEQLLLWSHAFFAKLISLFLGFFILILAVGLWIAKYNIILPVNSMAIAASAFAYNSDQALAQSVARIRELQIRTGDEIENLYLAFSKTTEDSMRYVTDLQHKTETISKMQSGLIMVLADMVESRDQNTGDHVRKTAAYTKIIMEQMRREGIYSDRLTDEFISNVVNSAPLHDVGKINISDQILNKPGRLTDEEFAKMRTHTTAGQEIIDKAIETVPESGYLDEARNLAAYHHEKWDGTGYPMGLKGEQIPLSARIMAVADVFDALVSVRCYKKAFSFEEACDIIREGMGTHFDPQVAQAFLDAEPQVRKVAEAFGRREYLT